MILDSQSLILILELWLKDPILNLAKFVRTNVSAETSAYLIPLIQGGRGGKKFEAVIDVACRRLLWPHYFVDQLVKSRAALHFNI